MTAEHCAVAQPHTFQPLHSPQIPSCACSLVTTCNPRRVSQRAFSVRLSSPPATFPFCSENQIYVSCSHLLISARPSLIFLLPVPRHKKTATLQTLLSPRPFLQITWLLMVFFFIKETSKTIKKKKKNDKEIYFSTRYLGCLCDQPTLFYHACSVATQLPKTLTL